MKIPDCYDPIYQAEALAKDKYQFYHCAECGYPIKANAKVYDFEKSGQYICTMCVRNAIFDNYTIQEIATSLGIESKYAAEVARDD